MLLFHTLLEDPAELQAIADDAVPLKSFQTTLAGPSGERGFYHYLDLADGTLIPQLTYAPDRQTWVRCGDSDLWIGWETARPPQPEALQRETLIDGVGLRMADGNVWQIPNGMQLPYRFGRDAAGNVCEVRSPQMQQIFDRTVWAFGECRELASRDQPITKDNAGPLGDYCGWLLSLNYRLTPPMAWALGLLDPDTIWNTLAGSTDWRAINRLIDSLSGQSVNDAATEDGQPVPFDAGPTSAAGGVA